MPCLNEAETIGVCIKKAFTFFERKNIIGEVVIGDNGSTDGSIEIAKKLGAIVVPVKNKGYGSASKGAIEAASGKYIITADTDDSHDILNLDLFLEKLDEGYEFVMGNRFKGEKKENAMPFLHRYLGNPVLTFIGNLFFKTQFGDFHCGLRGFTKKAYNKMNLKTTGMEFASEIVVKSSLLKLKSTEVPTTVFEAGRSRAPHLRSFPDGWRHLRFLLLYSPKWLFLYPGLLLILFCTVLLGYKYTQLAIDNILLLSVLFFSGFQFVVFYALTKVYATQEGLLPKKKEYTLFFKYFTLEKGIIVGFLTLLSSLTLVCLHFTQLLILDEKALLINSFILMTSVEIILFSFFFSILGLHKEK